MTPSPQLTLHPWTESYSEIIDVRSPSEYAEDHIPTAINLPVLTDAERADVGALYKQVSPFTARKVGAALVAKNLAHHLNTHFADLPKEYHPLIYCWRGGQRSQSMALVLTQVGWQVTVLQHGYKTYRAFVRAQLDSFPMQLSYRVLCGLTGTAKTEILRVLAQHQAQVLDLEALAQHRGSLLGAEWTSDQPSQKQFESQLLGALQALDPTQPVWIEAESSKIGQLHLPRSLWQAMQQAPCIEIQVPLACRVQGLLASYPHLIEHPLVLKQQLHQLKSRYGLAQIQVWDQLIETQQWPDLVKSLLTVHYDPCYRRSLQHHYTQVKQVYDLADLSASSLEALVRSLLII